MSPHRQSRTPPTVQLNPYQSGALGDAFIEAIHEAWQGMHRFRRMAASAHHRADQLSTADGKRRHWLAARFHEAAALAMERELRALLKLRKRTRERWGRG